MKKEKVGVTVESQYDPTRVKREEVVLQEMLGEHGHQFADHSSTDVKKHAASARGADLHREGRTNGQGRQDRVSPETRHWTHRDLRSRHAEPEARSGCRTRSFWRTSVPAHVRRLQAGRGRRPGAHRVPQQGLLQGDHRRACRPTFATRAASTRSRCGQATGKRVDIRDPGGRGRALPAGRHQLYGQQGAAATPKPSVGSSQMKDGDFFNYDRCSGKA